MAKKVITGWKHSWRLHTVKLGAVLAIVPELVWQLAQTLGAILPAIPQEIKEYLPQEVRVALALAGVLVVAVRLWRQRNVDHYFDRNDR